MDKKKAMPICDATLIGKWEDVTDLELSTVTHNTNDTEKLNGLLVYGYETKFGKTNQNAERYDKGAIDKFIKEYFIDNKLNMPVDIQHRDGDPDWIVGRIVYAESNDVGFYFVAYIPRTEPKYEVVKSKIENGILQGFSKYGWSVDYEWIRDDKEEYGGYWQVHEMQIVSMSIVTTPANAVRFERVKETKNEMRFVSNYTEEEESITPKIFRQKAAKP